jgi:hypothetical protein
VSRSAPSLPAMRQWLPLSYLAPSLREGAALVARQPPRTKEMKPYANRQAKASATTKKQAKASTDTV